MNRRGFLTALLAGTVLDPERLLWVPGKKLISIPKPLLSVRLVRVYDWYTQNFIQRMDVTYGTCALDGYTKTGITAREAKIMVETTQDWDSVRRATCCELIHRAIEEPETFHAYQTLHDFSLGKVIGSPVIFSLAPLPPHNAAPAAAGCVG